MTNQFIDQILQRIEQVSGLYYQLILVVSDPVDGKSLDFRHIAEQARIGFVNVNLQLSRCMLPLTTRQRSLRVASLLDDIVSAVDNEVVLLHYTNLLFDPSLRQDPLRLFQSLSRRKTIVIVWDGSIQQQYLIYAEPGHPEYRCYPTRDLVLIEVPEIYLSQER